jgi:F-type H+-transporting ATPase subunit alpha
LEAFSKFGSDLDAATMSIIDKGRKNVELLKQGLFSPLRVEQQISALYCGMQGLLKAVPMDKISMFEKDFHELMDAKYRDALQSLAAGVLNDDITKKIELAAREVALKYIDRKSEE